MPEIKIIQAGAEALEEYARVPIAFTVRAQLSVELLDGSLGGMKLVETPVDPPYLKDYDALETPADWATKFDLSHFVFFLAQVDGRLGGAAALVWDSPEIHMLDGRRDLAVLWDLRVHPDFRGQGVGRALFQHAAGFAREKGLRQMKIETQNNNVSACRFYHAMGCELGGISRFAYAHTPEIAHEAMMLWYLEL